MSHTESAGWSNVCTFLSVITLPISLRYDCVATGDSYSSVLYCCGVMDDQSLRIDEGN